MSLDARAFGAVGDGSTDDTAALQAAINAVSGGGKLVIPKGAYRITAPVEIPLSVDYDRVLIECYGAEFQLDGALAGLARERPQDTNSIYTNPKITIRGLRVKGKNLPGQHGFRFFTTFGLVLEDCDAQNCDIGFVSVFGLMAEMRNCFATNCETMGFFFASGASQIDFGFGPETAIFGGTPNNSSSNKARASMCRVFAKAGSYAHFKVDASEVVFDNCIAEGHSADVCFDCDSLDASTFKGITIREPHVECAPTRAIYAFNGTHGGTMLIEGQDTVVTDGNWQGALIQLMDGAQPMQIIMKANKVIYNVKTVVRGGNSQRHPQFILDTVNPTVWLDPANWESGVVGCLTMFGVFDHTNRAFIVSSETTVIETGYTEWNLANKLTVNSARDFVVNMDPGRTFIVNGDFQS